MGTYGDIDRGPTKDLIQNRRGEERIKSLYELAFAKRPAEELYDAAADPWQLKNLANDPAHAETRKRLGAEVETWMRETADPRAGGGGDEFDRYPYFGGEGPARRIRN